MRGHPPLQVMLLVVGFCLAAVPLARLTGNSIAARGGPAERAAIDESGKVVEGASPALVVVRFAHAPRHLVLRQGGRELLSVPAAERSPIESDVRIDTGPEAPDFVVEAEWAAGTPETAVTVEISPEGLETRSATHWSLDGTMQRVFQLSWK
jgi:hypothetical protein